jgi:hypothetical protein
MTIDRHYLNPSSISPLFITSLRHSPWPTNLQKELKKLAKLQALAQQGGPLPKASKEQSLLNARSTSVEVAEAKG